MYISNLVLIGISYLQLRTYILYIFLYHATIVSLVKILTSSHICICLPLSFSIFTFRVCVFVFHGLDNGARFFRYINSGELTQFFTITCTKHVDNSVY